jgi:hypothetical protein
MNFLSTQASSSNILVISLCPIFKHLSMLTMPTIDLMGDVE